MKGIRSWVRSQIRFRADYYDYNLLAVIILLVCFGLVILYSTSTYEAASKFGGNYLYYFQRQAVISLLAVLAAIAISLLDYHHLAKIALPAYLVSILLMALVMSPLGVERNGARRWLKIGISFQPSEIAKIAVIIFLPLMIIAMGRYIETPKGLAALFGTGGFAAFCAFLFTDNLSTGIIIGAITFVIIFVAHPRVKGFLITLGILAGMLGLFVLYCIQYIDSSENFRIRRVLAWLRPSDFSEEGGYQVMQALYAIGSGGFFGKGLGNSVQKLGNIPEAQNDMIFSIVCEELGVFGCIIVLALFFYLIYRLFFIAQNAPDLYGALMVTGVMAHIAFQVIFNVCVVVNLMPTTGITLPFISFGGTSVIFLMLEMSIALSVSRRIKFSKS